MAGWLASLWIAAALLTAASARADIYFWEDGEGTIHFSNQDVPPKASLYMREIATPVNPETDELQREIDRESLAEDIARKQAETQQRLEAANRKLDDALERVDDLTESVSRSRAQAADAAEAARQAEIDAQSARNYQSEVKERVIVHAVPYRSYDANRRHYKGHGINRHKHKLKNRHSRHLRHDKKIRSHFNRGKSRIEKLKPRRRGIRQHQIPGPVLPPGETRIPKAFGIR